MNERSPPKSIYGAAQANDDTTQSDAWRFDLVKVNVLVGESTFLPCKANAAECRPTLANDYAAWNPQDEHYVIRNFSLGVVVARPCVYSSKDPLHTYGVVSAVKSLVVSLDPVVLNRMRQVLLPLLTSASTDDYPGKGPSTPPRSPSMASSASPYYASVSARRRRSKKFSRRNSSKPMNTRIVSQGCIELIEVKLRNQEYMVATVRFIDVEATCSLFMSIASLNKLAERPLFFEAAWLRVGKRALAFHDVARGP